ncbi:MAG: hypothetical protein ACOYKZ_07765 [Chlamydiia bacterium]
MTVVSLQQEEGASPQPARRAPRLRFTFLCVAPLALLWACVSSFSLCIMALLWILTAAQASALRQQIGRLWRATRIGLISALGALLGLVSPRLGTTLVFLYLALHLQPHGQAPFLRCFRSAFEEFFE